MKYFGIICESLFKGYSNTVKSLLENIKDKEIIDIGEVDSAIAVKKIIDHQKNTNEHVEIVSAGDLGLRFWEEFSLTVDAKVSNYFEYNLATDKFYDMDETYVSKFSDVSNLKNINIYAPEETVNEYIKKYSDKGFAFSKSYISDLVSSPSKENIEVRAKDFAMLNPVAAELISTALSDDGKALFMGGRVSLPDGSFKENTKEIFAKAGADFVKDGKNGVVVFHGLRSFTKGDGSNDFAPVEAFYDSINSGLAENQTVVVLTKKATNDGKRKSLMKIWQKDNGIIFVNDYDLNDSKLPAVDYYFLLNEVVKNNLDLTATVEQMNFVPEALELGADRNKFKPYKWELSVPSNHAVYQKIESGKDVRTQKQAFNKFVEMKDMFSVMTNFQTQR